MNSDYIIVLFCMLILTLITYYSDLIYKVYRNCASSLCLIRMVCKAIMLYITKCIYNAILQIQLAMLLVVQYVKVLVLKYIAYGRNRYYCNAAKRLRMQVYEYKSDKRQN